MLKNFYFTKFDTKNRNHKSKSLFNTNEFIIHFYLLKIKKLRA
jgi:hypothetical protein